MDNLVRINNHDLQVKEFNGQRVVTFKDIDMLHKRVEGTAKRNFSENKNHFAENVDYFIVNKSEVGTDFVQCFGFDKFAPNGVLITESGYLMLVKSLTDDLAWKVQRELVNFYFKGQQLTKALVKDSKAGGLNGLLKTLNGVMKEEKISAWQRAEVLRDVAGQCGLTLSEKFIKKSAFIQISLSIPIN